MIMVRAIIRPEKTDEVLAALMYAGFPAVTKHGRLHGQRKATRESRRSDL